MAHTILNVGRNHKKRIEKMGLCFWRAEKEVFPCESSGIKVSAFVFGGVKKEISPAESSGIGIHISVFERATKEIRPAESGGIEGMNLRFGRTGKRISSDRMERCRIVGRCFWQKGRIRKVCAQQCISAHCQQKLATPPMLNVELNKPHTYRCLVT